MKLLKFTAMFMEKNLYDKFHASLDDYITFLLKFVSRDKNFRECKEYKLYEFEKKKLLHMSQPLIKISIKVKKTKIGEILNKEDIAANGNVAMINARS